MEFYCPVPECAHIGTIITKVHYRNEHGEEKEVIEIKYGKPQPCSVRGFNNKIMADKSET